MVHGFLLCISPQLNCWNLDCQVIPDLAQNSRALDLDFHFHLSCTFHTGLSEKALGSGFLDQREHLRELDISYDQRDLFEELLHQSLDRREKIEVAVGEIACLEELTSPLFRNLFQSARQVNSCFLKKIKLEKGIKAC